MEPLEQLEHLEPALIAIVSAVTTDDLDKPTPCAQFDVRGVLDHMTAGATVFAAAFRGQPAPPAPARGAGEATPGACAAALTSVFEAIREPGALERTIAAPFGEVPGATFARFAVLDGLVHGWDLAVATGRPYDPPSQLVAAAATFAADAVEPMRDGDTFADAVAPPDDATPIEKLAALTGRRVPA